MEHFAEEVEEWKILKVKKRSCKSGFRFYITFNSIISSTLIK